MNGRISNAVYEAASGEDERVVALIDVLMASPRSRYELATSSRDALDRRAKFAASSTGNLMPNGSTRLRQSLQQDRLEQCHVGMAGDGRTYRRNHGTKCDDGEEANRKLVAAWAQKIYSHVGTLQQGFLCLLVQTGPDRISKVYDIGQKCQVVGLNSCSNILDDRELALSSEEQKSMKDIKVREDVQANVPRE